jgi:uncharacterized membrane protein (DUF373 family)
MAENRKLLLYSFLGHIETAIYAFLGLLLAAAGILAIIGSVPLLASGVRDLTGTASILQLIDRLLLVLMLVELMHTVRISIRSHALVIEPFLIIGLIAIIRRILVLTLHTETYTGNAPWTPDVEAHFRASMIEACILALLVVVLITSIYIVSKIKAQEEADAEDNSKHSVNPDDPNHPKPRSSTESSLDPPIT